MPISQALTLKADGTVLIQITVPFAAAQAPQAGCATIAPSISNLSPSQSSSGGSLAGGHNYYYCFDAQDFSGLLSDMSGIIEVIVPAGTNTNQITLAGISPFDANAAQFDVYRAIDVPSALLKISGPNSVPGTALFSFTDTGFATSNVLPPSQGLYQTKLYWRRTGDLVWQFAAASRDNTQTSIAFYLPLNIAGQSIDLQLRSVAHDGTETPEVLAPVQSYAVTAIYPSFLKITGTGSSPVSFTVQGSIPPVLPQAIFSYSSTTTSLTITWTAFTIYRSDGTTASVPASTSGTQITVTGLSPSTQYFFYPAYDEVAGAVILAGGSGAVGSPALMFTSNSAIATANQNLQSVSPLSNGAVNASTPSSGTGSGGTTGGGTHICVRSTMLVETRERGVVPIEACEIGEHLRTLDGLDWDAWTEIKARRVVPMERFVRISTDDGRTVEITPTHHIILADLGDCEASKLSLGDALIVRTGYAGIDSIAKIRAENGKKVSLRCDPIAMFYAGEKEPGILVHNAFPIS